MSKQTNVWEQPFVQAFVVFDSDAENLTVRVVWWSVEELGELYVCFGGEWFEPVDQVVATECCCFFEFAERYLWLVACLADKAKRCLRDEPYGVIEKTFVDVSDLFNFESSVTELSGFAHSSFAELEDL